MNLFSASTYHFDLPQSLIADTPLKARDQSRLLVVNRLSRTIEHKRMLDLPYILTPDYVLVANNTRVFKARLLGEREGTGGKVEFFLLSRVGDLAWVGMMKAGAKVMPGFKFQVVAPSGEIISAEVSSRIDAPEGALFEARFSKDPVLLDAGEVPLPPYIIQQREAKGLDAVSPEELEDYNTVFAKESGSVAAPTAGRHFTVELMDRLKKHGNLWEEITLHVGIGTFKPVNSEDIRNHSMHGEMTTITEEVAKRLNEYRRSGKRILAVGTTTARTLEGRALLCADPLRIEPGSKEVNLYIHPGSGHEWRWADALLTNFHLPGSTLLMMVASRIGDPDFTLQVYHGAIEEKYRFYSYGDAMLILDR
ncbi:MAG: tRNA preQ1(34) S-adenosylmethionine ribosyltransferase-isomerase QueA [Bdellovibrionales bacterium]|nr:tRNA preQ1(34) S-adenosylmethionine ribosyltransferase-isomerase QueA [Bdellovibrionales bacterium]